MNATINRPREDGLSAHGFRSLLAWLGPDERGAADAYELLRHKLIVYFIGRKDPNPEELADEVLDRLGRKLAGGEVIRDLSRYAYGVARLVLTQATRDRRRRLWLLERNGPALVERTEPAEERVECLRACAERFRPDDRLMVMRYYEGDGRERQEARRTLAEELGIPPGALRLRVFRLKAALEQCTRECLARRRTRQQ